MAIPAPMALSISAPASSSLIPVSRQVHSLAPPLHPPSNELPFARFGRFPGPFAGFTSSWSLLQVGRWTSSASSAKPAAFNLRRPVLVARAGGGNAPSSPVDGTDLSWFPACSPASLWCIAFLSLDPRCLLVRLWQKWSLSSTWYPASVRSCPTPSCSMISRSNNFSLCSSTPVEWILLTDALYCWPIAGLRRRRPQLAPHCFLGSWGYRIPSSRWGATKIFTESYTRTVDTIPHKEKRKSDMISVRVV
jgi:hypothetical protein